MIIGGIRWARIGLQKKDLREGTTRLQMTNSSASRANENIAPLVLHIGNLSGIPRSLLTN